MKSIPLAAAAVLGCALACDTSSGPVTPPIMADASGGSCTNANRVTRSNEIYQGKWDCGTRANAYVTVFGGGSPTPYLSQISTAVTRWNAALFNDHNLPRLASVIGGNPPPSDPGPYVRVEIHPSAGGGDWCGKAPSTVIMYQGASLCSSNVPFATLSNFTDVVTHELGHAQGFDHPKDRTILALHSCIMFVPDDPPYNTSPCEHESQSVYWAYGLRGLGPDLTQAMYGVVPSVTPTAPTIVPGATQEFTASASAGENNPAPGVTWSLSNPSVASLTSQSSSTAVVQGTAEGQTLVMARVVEAPWITWPMGSGSATLTVQQPPPPPPPAVATVTIDPNGVTLVGPTDATLTATARDAQGNTIPDVTFTWSVRDTAIIYFVPSGGSAWISAKRNGSTTVWARAPNGVTAAITVTVQNCPVRCYA